MTDWFRSWHGAPTDPKWLGIARHAGIAPGIAVAIAWALMDRASQAEDRGSIVGYDADGLAYFFGCEPEQVEAVVSSMTAKGIIVDGRFSSWERRQPKREDDSSGRVKAWREQQKATQANAGERDVTQRNAPEAETDTDTEAEKQQAPHPVAARGRAELDRLEAQFREAAGLTADPSPGLLSLAPLIALLDSGHDLELDVLPTLRTLAARAKRRPRTWDYFTDAIREASAHRRGLMRSGLAPPVAPVGAAKRQTTADILGELGRKMRHAEQGGNDRDDAGGIPRLGLAG